MSSGTWLKVSGSIPATCTGAAQLKGEEVSLSIDVYVSSSRFFPLAFGLATANSPIWRARSAKAVRTVTWVIIKISAHFAIPAKNIAMRSQSFCSKTRKFVWLSHRVEIFDLHGGGLRKIAN